MADTTRTHLYDGDTFTHRGATFRVTFPYDDDHEAPWEDGDGRGIVREFERGIDTYADVEAAGDRVLDTRSGPTWVYCVAATVAKARRERWGGDPHEAAEAEYQHFRAWCHEGWEYIGVVVDRLDKPGEASLWGIESDDDETWRTNRSTYPTEVAYELADEILGTEAPDLRAAVVAAGAGL